jgi:hypothetical protein
MSTSAQRARTRKASLVSAYGPDHPEVAAADYELRVVRLTQEIIKDTGMGETEARNLAAFIVTETDTAPPLTAEQKNRLALLLSPGGHDPGVTETPNRG